MSKFKFEPSDFTFVGPGCYSPGTGFISIETAVRIANERMTSWLKDAKVVYIQEHETGSHVSYMPRDKGFSDNYKALLICIEPIEKCKHEASKLTVIPYCSYESKPNLVGPWQARYECSCGARVKPSGFEVVK